LPRNDTRVHFFDGQDGIPDHDSSPATWLYPAFFASEGHSDYAADWNFSLNKSTTTLGDTPTFRVGCALRSRGRWTNSLVLRRFRCAIRRRSRRTRASLEVGPTPPLPDGRNPA